MLASVLIGALLIGATVAVHTTGTIAWIAWARKRVPGRRGVIWTVRLLVTTALTLALLHSIEVVIWAMAYLLHGGVQGVETFEQAVYFSMVTFTTVGYGDITLSGQLRLLSGIQGLNGILLFGWSTALLFGMVQHLFAETRTRPGDDQG
jgi:hypothetical protein